MVINIFLIGLLITVISLVCVCVYSCFYVCVPTYWCRSLACKSTQPWVFSCLHLSTSGVVNLLQHSSFLNGLWDQNPGIYACTASTLHVELSLHTYYKTLKIITIVCSNNPMKFKWRKFANWFFCYIGTFQELRSLVCLIFTRCLEWQHRFSIFLSSPKWTHKCTSSH